MAIPGFRSDERGFTLIELLVTMTILVVGLFGAVALLDGANARTAVTAQREAATALSREVLEDARSVPYQRLTPTGIKTALEALPGLADTNPSTTAWTVQRRNNTYTLIVEACSADDGDDGYGDHTGGNFCSGPSGTSDRSPDDYKRVSVTVRWTRGGLTRDVKQSTIVDNEANASGPDLQFVNQEPPGNLSLTTVTDPSWDRLTFTVQTTVQAAAIKYMVDGVTKASDAPSGLTDKFTWRFDGGPDGHLPDGTYVISATAYDDKSRPGPTRSRTIRLNRDLPVAPSNVDGGWNALRDVGEIDWNRNPEPDVIGYRVYRYVGSSAGVLVCQFVNEPNRTSCVDDNPPPDQSFSYRVVALDDDPDTANPREGAFSSALQVTRSSNQPNPPGALTAAASGGDLVLSWSVPPAASPSYSGDTVSFYRVYRDGTSIGDRIGIRAPGSATSYLDGGEASGGHRYWLTAVDQNYSESTLVGPVSAP